MPIDPLHTWEAVEAIRAKAPVVHSITNYVVMNNTANALLALGASPVMAHAREEMTEMVGIASALVINIGTLSEKWIESMHAAAEAANARRIPIILDPVGAGATSYRTGTVRELLKGARPTILRGNASEIMATCGDLAQTKGVDSTEASHDALAAAHSLGKSYGATVSISGETDYIVGGGRTIRIHNGHAMMPRVTGLGCTATALTGAFAAVTPDPVLAAAQAMAVMGIAGEMAAEKAEGPGTLQLHFIDALYRMTADDVQHRIRVEA
ncbi:MAG: hydroxyethylthiazole kinase [Holophagaceae bacterium]|nr:hydroxyethylthiazole kinase [Holophagaceae bacterium]